ncbi:MAG: GAF domain-containing protein [Candidatus Onthomonas sp.]
MENTKLDSLIEPYGTLAGQLEALLSDEENLITGLANASALLYGALEDVNWAGFYLRQGKTLVLGPFQGKPACTRIPLGKGVCGTAAALDNIQRVPDVHAFPGHIACDSASRSEIVLPLHRDGVVMAVLDIDSPCPGRFSPADEAGLLRCAEILEAFFGAAEPEVTLFWTER